jgi:hypothetical protein
MKLPQWVHRFQLKIFNKTVLWVYENVSIVKSLMVFVRNIYTEIVGYGDSPLYIKHSQNPNYIN